MKLTISVLIVFVLSLSALSAKSHQVSSPDGNITAIIHVNSSITWEVVKNGQRILLPSGISLKTNKVYLGDNPLLMNVEEKEASEILYPVVPLKSKSVKNEYRELNLSFQENYQLIVRAYNEGVAYRWKTNFTDQITVESEDVNFNFEKDFKIWFPEEESTFSHQERKYKYINLSEIDTSSFCSTGTLVELDNTRKVFISESALSNYPGMFLKGSNTNNYGLKGKFAGYPLETKQVSDRDVKVVKHANYLAIADGDRSFPWRVILISDHDKELVESQLIYKLSNNQKIKDTDWIRPGKVAWDWWNDLNISGVDFKSGVNTATYKYYIDFAAQYGLEYVILDEGWYHLEDVLKIKKEVDLPELLKYGKEKSVGIILWVTWKALEDQLDKAITTFSEWGVKGIKVDFMQRDDQWMVNYYERVAKKAAKHHLLVDFHGAYKPCGLSREYPNVLTYEGVYGLEQNKWTDDETPDHNLTLPFIRMVAGAMDFTPGAMINANKTDFRAVWSKPMSMGTRCHQLAMYIIYESPLQMLADNPTHYYREPECMEFLSVVPTTWDQTKVLHAKVGDYLAIARKKDNIWYLGAMTDWEARNMDINLDFLDEEEYILRIWKDGINANRNAMDFKQETKKVSRKSTLKIQLASGGGFVGILEKQ